MLKDINLVKGHKSKQDLQLLVNLIVFKQKKINV